MPLKPPPDDYPITGMCIVADPNKCPPGYDVMMQSHDNKSDCDMWKDSFFRSRVTRYLCYTRIFPLDSGRLNNVLADITINNAGELPPQGFSLIEKTVDTGEKASRKKQICVKMLPRNMCSDAINSIIFLSKQKRAPAGYCLVGEMNGLILCFKIGNVPKEADEEQINQSIASGVNQSAPTPPPHPTHQSPQYPGHPQHHTGGSQRSQLTRQDSSLAPSNQFTIPHEMQGSMYGVPFRLNSCFQDGQGLHTDNIPVVHYRSVVDIDSEYTYSFHLEHQAQALSPTRPTTDFLPV